jgi:hypothetical protein
MNIRISTILALNLSSKAFSSVSLSIPVTSSMSSSFGRVSHRNTEGNATECLGRKIKCKNSGNPNVHKRKGIRKFRNRFMFSNGMTDK